jgi:hypothetical protein
MNTPNGTMENVRSNAVVNVGWSDDGHVCTINVLGSGKPLIVFDRRKASGPNRDHAERYGWEVRLTRQAAIGKDGKTGKSASPATKWERVNGLATHIMSGTDSWSPKRAETISMDETLLSQAMLEAFPKKTADEVREKVVSCTREERDALRMDARVKPIYDRLVAAQIKGVDTKKVLAGW